MDPPFFATPTGIAVIAAASSFVAGVVGAGISSWTIHRTHKQRLSADERLAERKFEFDRSLSERRVQLDLSMANRKRRIEMAEAVLASFYEVRDIYSDARSPLVWAGEMVPQEGDSERVKEASYAPIKRLSRHNEVFARFWSKEYEFAALFGSQAREPYHAVRSVDRDMRWAVEDLLDIKTAGSQREERERYKKAYDIAFRPSINEPDPIREKLDDAVKQIETVTHSTVEAMHDGAST